MVRFVGCGNAAAAPAGLDAQLEGLGKPSLQVTVMIHVGHPEDCTVLLPESLVAASSPLSITCNGS